MTDPTDPALAFMLMTIVIAAPFILLSWIAGVLEEHERRKHF